MLLTKIPVRKKTDYYLTITDAYRENGKVKRRSVMKIGYLSDLKKEYDDPIAHFTELAKKMTEEKKLTGGFQNVLIDFSQPAEDNKAFKTGSIIVNKMLKIFSLDYTFRKKRDESKIKCNLQKIFNFLVANQILNPSSKLSAYEKQENLYGFKNIKLHDVYRSLSYISDLSVSIQNQIYKRSSDFIERKLNTMYYDCTNYYFEIEIEDDFRKYGFSKEHRPNPIVQMGLFADENGIPICFDLFKGNQNEQLSMVPIEEDFLCNKEKPHLIICADAGLCSANNKYFNSVQNRDYIFVQSLKKVKQYLSNEIFSETNDKWVVVNDKFKYFVRPINDEISVKLANNSQFKTSHEANLIITYDEDFANYLKYVRDKRIEKALKIIASPSRFNKESAKDGKQYIKKVEFNNNGEIITRNLELDIDKIKEEEKYDGYYALITSLIYENPLKVISINKKRWEIEDCFRVLKTDLKARPVYLTNEDRIKTHFLINFVALTILKMMQKKLRETLSHEETTITKILDALREMQLIEMNDTIYLNGNVNELTRAICKLLDIKLDNKYIRANYLRTLTD